jgi:DNA-binding IscR family transcriptional regulator
MSSWNENGIRHATPMLLATIAGHGVVGRSCNSASGPGSIRRAAVAHSPAEREKLALHMMLLIGQNFYHGLDPMNVSDRALRLRIPAGMLKEFRDLFAQTKLVLPLADKKTFVLGRAPETITIKDILDCVRNAGKKVKNQPDPSEEEMEINDLLLNVDQSTAETLKGKHLQGLILSLSSTKARR